MTRSLTISRKIALGFSALLLLTGLLGGLAVSSMRTVQGAARTLATEFVPEVDASDALQRDLAENQLAIRSYGFTGEAKYLQQTRDGLAAVHRDLDRVQKLGDEHPLLVKSRETVGQMKALVQDYEASVQQTEMRNVQINQNRQKLDAAAAGFITHLDLLLGAQRDRLQQEISKNTEQAALLTRVHKLVLAQEIRGYGNAARIAAFKAQALRDPAIFGDSLKNFEPLETRIAELRSLLKVAADVSELDQVEADALAYRDAVRVVQDDTLALAEIGKKRLAAAEKVEALARELASTGMKRTVEAADSSHTRLERSSTTLLGGMAAALVVGFVVAFIINRGITRVLTRVADDLSMSSEQVTAAAGQVATASQSLAEGSSEQAASLEETSASLEEMASMTKRNADSAHQAKDLSNVTRTSADLGAQHMDEMRQAMSAIKASSDDIAKIIKTIDEIAFQTNLLALNAAVEAARAGEAGMGFAVVAEEVRALAQRSAVSARETAQKIEEAIRKTEHGVVVSAKVAETLTDIVDKARRMDILVAEIATASSEQSQGITQLNGAVSQMDRVTQGNASSAEESAAAAEELNAQAVAMRDAVGDLRRLCTTEVIAPAEAPLASPPRITTLPLKKRRTTLHQFADMTETSGVN